MGFSLTALSSFGGVTAAILPLVLLGVVIIVAVGNRAEPDPSGRRPFAVYYFAVSFVAVFAVLFSSYEVVHALMSLAGSPAPGGDEVARVTVLGLLVAICSGAVLAIHVRRGLVLARLGGGPLDPTLRVAQTYVASVSFLAVLIGLIAAVGTLYSVFGAAGPGVFNPSGTRADALASLVDALYLVVASLLILGAHLRLAPPYLRPLGGQPWPRLAGSTGAASPTGTPTGTNADQPEQSNQPDYREPVHPYEPHPTWQPPTWEPPGASTDPGDHPADWSTPPTS